LHRIRVRLSLVLRKIEQHVIIQIILDPQHKERSCVSESVNVQLAVSGPESLSLANWSSAYYIRNI
jgi:ribosomal protein L18